MIYFHSMIKNKEDGDKKLEFYLMIHVFNDY